MNKRERWIILTILTLLLVGLFSALNTLELRAEEPRRAVVAIEMFLTGEWIIPKINGYTYYNKPPFFNWILALFFWMFGSMEEWVVRLPGLLALLLTALVIYRIGKQYLPLKVAILAALSFLTFGDLLFYGSVNSGEIDLFFTLIICLQGFTIFHFLEKKAYWTLFLLSYLLTSIAFLSKGLPALVFQALTLVGYLIYQKQWKRLFSIAHFAGIVVFLSIVGLYFYLYHQKENVLPFLVNLLHESTQRTSAKGNMTKSLLHLLTFPLEFLKLLLPWGLALGLLFWKGYRMSINNNPLLRFCAFFVLVNVGIYWISPGTLDRYLYPFFPFCALLLASLSLQHPRIKFVTLLYLVGVLAIARIAFNYTFLPYQQRNLKALIYRDLSKELLTASNKTPIYFIGKLQKAKVKPTLLGIKFSEAVHQLPPPLPYQIPYYSSKATNEVMRYEPFPKMDVHYIAYKDFIYGKKVQVLLEFTEKWNNRQMVLVKFDEVHNSQ